MWKEQPALFWGLCILLGCSIAYYYHPALLTAILFLLLTLFKKDSKSLTKLCGGILIIVLSFWYSSTSGPKNNLRGDTWEGSGYFSIRSIKPSASPFHKNLSYEGTFKIFETVAGGQAFNLPCRIYLPQDKNRPDAGADYFLQGVLSKKKSGAYAFKPNKKTEWSPIQGTWNCAELRYRAKKAVQAYLKKYFSPKNASFFHALSTGDSDERILSLEFKRLGLQHILAISGFHFGLMAAFLGFFLRLFFSYRISYTLLILLLGLYFIFLGEAPSIERAWAAITVAFIGILAKRKSNGLNALGVSLIFVLLCDPQFVDHIGFLLSFLCTLAILLYFPLINGWLSFFLPKRTIAKTSEFSLLDQHGAIFSALARQALAVNISVHLLALPVLLFLFHQFPLLSLLYNLFFPLGVTISFFLLLLGMMLHLIAAPLGTLLHLLNDSFTSFLLKISSTPPPFLDVKMNVKALPFTLVVFYFVFVFYAGLRLRLRNRASP